MRHARRAIAILSVFATSLVAAATAAYATVQVPRDSEVAPVGLSLWQLLAFVALGVLLAVAIVGLGHSLSRSRRSESSQRPLRA